ncbi:RND family transporter [Candidatus Eisenbacteria bacterium]|uniref:RND family transporter n=1 Tax=Eiseniibacteriota bacterium TaxID=2212470 RepID=A0ABV6YHZ1_UNCEI
MISGPTWLSKLALGHSRICLLIFLLATMAIASGALRLQIRTDGTTIYPPNHPVISATQRDRLIFHENEVVIVLATATSELSSFRTHDGLRTLRSLHESLTHVPGVHEVRTRSLAKLLDVRPGQAALATPWFLEPLPANDAELDSLLTRIDDLEIVHAAFLSEDGSAAAFYIPVAEEIERKAFLNRLDQWVAEQGDHPVELRLTGPVAAEVRLGDEVLRDLARLVPAMLLVVTLVLFVSLGSPAAVITCLIEIGTVLTWTVGLMGHLGSPLTLVTTILPVVILAIAITDEVHLLDRFRRHVDMGSAPAAAIIAAVREMAPPIVLTSITTASAFLSFLTASITPMREFGAFAAFGIVAAMFLSFTLVPVVIVTLPTSWTRPLRFGAGIRRAIRIPHPGGRSAIVATLLLAACIPGALRLSIEDSWIDNFSPKSPLVIAAKQFDKLFWGAYRYDVVLESQEAAFFQLPAGIAVVESLSETLADAPHVGGVLSQLTPYEQFAVLDEKEGPISKLGYETVKRFSGYLMKIQRWVDLDYFLRGDGRQSRVRLLVRNANFSRTRALEEYVHRTTNAALAGTDLSYHVSGELPSAQAAVGSIVGNLMRSIGLTIAVTILLLAAAMRSIRTACVMTLPLLAAVAAVFGAMGYAGVPLGIATSMFGAVAIGVGIDYGIHFVHANASVGPRAGPAARRAALDATAHAVIWNSAILTLGFAVLALSDMRPNRSLGILLAAAMLVSCAATIVILPGILGRLRR